MPETSEILAQIFRIANGSVGVAVGWHVAAAVVLAALIGGWRPSVRTAGVLLALPMLSVSALAWIHGNPVNGTLFLAGAGGVAWGGLARGAVRTERGPLWTTVAGLASIAFGWTYPHFVSVRSPYEYLYAAPMGVLPCPTLALLVGMALLGGGLGGAPSSMVLAALGLFYGVTGIFALGVPLDVGLLAGALALAVLTARRAFHPRRRAVV